MKYKVTTRRSPLNVRRGPGLNYRVVSSLARGAIVNVIERRETSHSGVWCRVERGWAAGRYLTPVAEDRNVHNEPTETQSLPRFLFYDPEIEALERRITFLRNQTERAEDLAYVNGQMAAAEGSRLYRRDPFNG